ncbi:outer membrane protein [Bartonella taylorii]|uniref:outer membrane protein n=1 Tax=Bartonella taylorii TaxID=33046 RepID=UPI001ABB025F|nr:outer membrane protein [Bartonella taylorii]
MNTKRLITASIFALISASTVQAADVMIPHQQAPVVSSGSSSAFVAPAFTWAGFYLGGQIGGFSSKTDMNIIDTDTDIVDKDRSAPLPKNLSPKLSGFEGVGVYIGSNIELGDNFIFGVDTDLMWSGNKQTKTITVDFSDGSTVDSVVARSGRPVHSASIQQASESSVPAQPAAVGGDAGNRGGAGHSHYGANPHGSAAHGAQMMAGHGVQAAGQNSANLYNLAQIKREIAEFSREQGGEIEALNHTLKQNWTGATRLRIGFAADRFMPYVSGGVAYAQLHDIVSISFKKESGKVLKSQNLTDETKMMVGYTLGGGFDFAVLDNVILRAEYRYSDFGKKKFAKEKFEINYKTNDFRVGVAYKF